ncbi:MAG: hypothetical protein AMJ53_10170 [Gammaproteobacteria bacterium SG8_11]|nr:MAG: hypothetical protein AMJ53_10170 [Gammaproteobacteria bacterium SG8_11]
MGFVYWVYKNTASGPVLDARDEAGLSRKKINWLSLLGFLVAVLLVATYSLNHGSSAVAAKKRLPSYMDRSIHITLLQ